MRWMAIIAGGLFATAGLLAQPPAALHAPSPVPTSVGQGVIATDGKRVYPINLPTALALANARPVDVQLAARQVQAAAAVYDRARFQWLPTISVGGDYFHHNGNVQNFQGEILNASRSSLMAGFGANATLGLSDAIFAPLAARQDLRAKQSQQLAVQNDLSLAVSEAYFAVQQARGELAGLESIVRESHEVVRKVDALAEGLTPPLEADRARVEHARRRQALTVSRERWRHASAELARLLRLDPAAGIEPLEPANLTVKIIDPNVTLDDLIPLALITRPELQAQQSLVAATLSRLKQEKIRPLMPSVLVRSVSTNPSGSLAYGTFSGGPGSKLGNANDRFDYDIQLLWQFENLGLGNRARSNERQAEHDMALLDFFKTQDRIAADVVKAFAENHSAAERLAEAEPAYRLAASLLSKSLEGMSQTRRNGNFISLIVRPAEVVAALQSASQANADYFAAVADFNRAQFRLYRALGHPAMALSEIVPAAILGRPK
jgi:outer membrane protein TolC